MAKVGIVIGSSSDESVAQETVKVLEDLGIDYEVRVLSAHRNPQGMMEYATTARQRGIDVLIGMAGGSAALPGALASWTTVPVIGVPLSSSELNGIDSLLSIAQMPPGIPVACVAVGSWGARNAAYLAAQLLGLKDDAAREAYEEHRNKLRNR